MHLQNPYFYFFANVPKIIKDIKNKFKNKGQIWNLHYQISLTQLKNLFKKLVQTIYFFQNWPFFGTYAGQNTTLSLPKDVFSYRNPFDNCLIMKMLNNLKFDTYWLTLLYIVQTVEVQGASASFYNVQLIRTLKQCSVVSCRSDIWVWYVCDTCMCICGN